MFNMVMDRYKANMMPLFIVGLIAAVIKQIPMMLVTGMLGGAAAFVAIKNDPQQILAALQDPATLAQLILGAIVGMIVIAIISWITSAIANGTVFAAVRDTNQGQTPDMGRSLKEGLRLFAKLLVYGLLSGLTFLGIALINIIPILGTIVFLVFLIPLIPAFSYFGVYALVNEELSPTEAYGRAWGSITKAFGTSFMSGLVLFLISIVFGIVGMISFVLGPLAFLVAIALAGIQFPFVALYMSMTYQEKIRSLLG